MPHIKVVILELAVAPFARLQELHSEVCLLLYSLQGEGGPLGHLERLPLLNLDQLALLQLRYCFAVYFLLGYHFLQASQTCVFNRVCLSSEQLLAVLLVHLDPPLLHRLFEAQCPHGLGNSLLHCCHFSPTCWNCIEDDNLW